MRFFGRGYRRPRCVCTVAAAVVGLAGCLEDPGLQERVDRLQAEVQEKERQLQESQSALEKARSELKAARAANAEARKTPEATESPSPSP